MFSLIGGEGSQTPDSSLPLNGYPVILVGCFLYLSAEFALSSLREGPQVVQVPVYSLLDGKFPEGIPKAELDKISWRDTIWFKFSFCDISHLMEGTD